MKKSELKQLIKEVLDEITPQGTGIGVWWEDLGQFVKIENGKLIYDKRPISEEEADEIIKWFNETIPFAQIEKRNI